jgi:hypothetical protein
VKHKREEVLQKFGPIFKGVSEEQLDKVLSHLNTPVAEAKEPSMEVGQIDNSLKMNITFNQEMLAPEGDIDQDQYSNLLHINLVTEADVNVVSASPQSGRRLQNDEAPELKFGWNIEQHTPTFIEVQLDPDQPDMLSQFYQDSVEIKVLDTSMFRSALSG